ncbi:MAG TPA: EthD family reductase [Ignavibacteria bacterium]|nr:EthD family reductase [Ignavibacteria bacterium]
MTKLIALYKKPENIEDFENKYFNEHMPLVNKMPGLIKSEVVRLKGIGGEGKFYLQATMYFDNEDKLNEAMASPEGRASAKNLMSFAKDYVTMYIGEDN